MTKFLQHLKNSGCYVKHPGTSNTYTRIQDDSVALQTMNFNTEEEEPLEAPTMNFGEQGQGDIVLQTTNGLQFTDSPKPETPLELPKMDFSGQGEAATNADDSPDENPLEIPRLEF